MTNSTIPFHIREIEKLSERCVHFSERDGCRLDAVQAIGHGRCLRPRPLRALLLQGAACKGRDGAWVDGERIEYVTEMGGDKPIMMGEGEEG